MTIPLILTNLVTGEIKYIRNINHARRLLGKKICLNKSAKHRETKHRWVLTANYIYVDGKQNSKV